MEPPRKKQRTTRESEPAILSREMGDVETSLEVDHMILDYLLYNATTACLTSREQPRYPGDDEHVRRALLQADEFLALFKRRYGKYNFDPEMRFRQQLLQLVTLFTQRFTRNYTTPSKQSLETLREKNQARARQWIGTASRVPSAQFDTKAYETELPLSEADLENNRASVLATLDIPAEDDLYEDAFYGTRAAVSLLDLLPMFMAVSAQISEICNSKMKEPLMQLAATWMLQACLEQYCVFGASGTDAIDEAFAWGYKVGEPSDPRPPERQRSEGRVTTDLDTERQCHAPDTPSRLVRHKMLLETRKVNGMFEDEQFAKEVDGWQEIRDAAIEELFTPNRAGDLPAHLTHQLEAHAYARAENAFLGYVKALAQCIPTPVLVQLERGELEGMTREETQDFIKGCGVGIMELLA